MKPRMMCTDCFQTAEADTVLEGSDIVELLGWCCLAVPGLLYCWWRHALRIKVCAFCGGRELVREARAARRRESRPLPSAGGPRVRNLSGPVRWPRALGTPRDRLRHGGVGAFLLVALLLGCRLSPFELAAPSAAAAITPGFALLGCAWLIFEIVRLSRMRATLRGCRAWDQNGRPLRIERVF